jgi:hypothetical protein
MKVVEELRPRYDRQLRNTLVQARNGTHYKILTHQLYDREPPAEFHNFEVNVQQVEPNGRFRELIVPYYRRYYVKEEALAHHQRLLESFDETLSIEEPKEHKKEEKKEEAAH